MKLLSLFSLSLLVCSANLIAQAQAEQPEVVEEKVSKQEMLLSPSVAFSHKKLAYVTLNDGTEVKGNITDLDRKKGLIEQVKIKDGSGKKHKMKPDDIKHMYLPPSGLTKLSKAYDVVFDSKKWNNQRLNQDLINQGYAYFEQTDVKIKKKTNMLLVQLLNPSFCENISVYHDPKAKETKSLGVGGINVAGGIAKSYYLKKNSDNAAYKLTKKDYQKQFTMFWSDNSKIAESYPDGKWRDLTEHIHLYNSKN
ncbi:hypothetical protein [Saccharicrinis aurantiacus]|uniref:hypothetical protein n=1 Tax=Saccharicrinis aurantiacus TaxID=1849719 RepID=UPI0024927FE0|nr:hypothetical protein [Saccharicrinis aurantiacus]